MWIPISEAPIACFPHFEVAAESGDWIVVDKGAPLIVHPSNGKKEPCLLEGVEALLSYEIANGAVLSLVNRLDRETSGLTLVAKTKGSQGAGKSHAATPDTQGISGNRAGMA